MLLRHPLFVCALLLMGAALAPAASGQQHHHPVDTGDMRASARHFLDLLNSQERAKASFTFDSEERHNWHYIPRARLGLPLEEMDLEQRRAAHDLMRTALSTQGYLKATSIMRLEEILKEIGDAPDTRDPDRYYFSVFGDPAGDAPWGWRLEGHHIALNYTSVSNELVAVTPAFFGTNPAELRTGPYAGLRVLGAEEDLARSLLQSLSPDQLQRTMIASEAPRDIITTNDRQAILENFEGLPASAMTPEQQEALLRIIHEYTHNMRDDVAHEQMRHIEEAGIGKLYFAWAGSPERGEPHYYRIHGPTVLFEYDNTQTNANHAHAVWRDLTNDFGEDLLREHYETAPHSHGH